MSIKKKLLGLVVADMAKSLAFYRALGLDIPADLDKKPHAEFQIPGGPLIAWDTIATINSFDPDWTAPTGGSRAALAFRCETPAAVDDRYATLTTAGHEGHKPPWNAFWGQRYAILHDPDGNSIDLFCPNGE
jgi:catechol 2,3-dioxygenase-like lactoylglutathione lyase family enzyme